MGDRGLPHTSKALRRPVTPETWKLWGLGFRVLCLGVWGLGFRSLGVIGFLSRGLGGWGL